MTKAIRFTKQDILIVARAQGRPTDFIHSLDFELKAEGVVDEIVSGDAGGETVCGITQSDYDDYRKENNSPKQSVALIAASEVASVYWHHYWLPVHGEDVCFPTDEVLDDAAVNMGVGTAVKVAQGVLGTAQDGQFGPQTMAALDNYIASHGQAAFINAYIARRDARYDAIGKAVPGDLKFEAGWHSRDADLLADARAALA